jgi:hypothetical protein
MHTDTGKQDVLVKLDKILEKSDINNYSISKLPQLIQSVVGSENEYRDFLRSPYAFLLKAGLDPAEVDIDMLTEFVIFAFEKHNKEDVELLNAVDDDGIPSHLGATMNKQETDEGSNVNWENKVESTFWYEENVSTTGKRTSQKLKQKHSFKDKKMAEDGKTLRFAPENFLKPEIRHLFFPSQQLVTPELVEEIKRRIK